MRISRASVSNGQLLTCCNVMRVALNRRVATIALCVMGISYARADLIFTITRDAQPLDLVNIDWDVTANDGNVRNGVVNPGTVPLDGLSASSIAGLLASSINNSFARPNNPNPTVAKRVGNTVVVHGAKISFVSKDTSIGPLPGGVSVSYGALALNMPGLFTFSPDPTTGFDILTQNGLLEVSGPGGLDAFFSAPPGTSGNQLAILLAAAMSAPGYAVSPIGNSVLFQAPTIDPVSFLCSDCGGFDLELSTVPEPRSAALLAVGLLGLGLIMFQRRKVRLAYGVC